MKLKGEVEFPKENSAKTYQDGIMDENVVLKAKAWLNEDIEITLALKMNGDVLSELERQLNLDKIRRRIVVSLEPSPQTNIGHFAPLTEEQVKAAEEKQHKKKKQQQAKESKKIDDLEFLPEEESKKDESL